MVGAGGEGTDRSPAAGWLRVAGSARLADGRRLLWSVAEGVRGRRWRWAIARGDAVGHAVLLETDPDGRPVRLEATSASGLLTLHPDPDFAALHGNLVTTNGIEHLSLPWSAGHVIDVVDAFGPFVVVACRGMGLPVEGSLELGGLGIDRFLRPTPGVVRLVRTAETAWSLVPGEPAGRRRAPWSGTLTGDGLPRLPDGTCWPLELD
ncbi:MAG: hypothetical protein KatS3mg065_0463 [Chloroflexota bacterium]|nr:MAG: hypothetical protein KatS3mg065_0463 [Chloroflexota bacterium]